jgi:hypothetical protein
MPRMTRFGPSCLAFALGSMLFAGCHASHVGGGDPRRCGDALCDEGERCCLDCDGDGTCFPVDLPCPRHACMEECRGSDDCPDDALCRFEPGVCGGLGQCEVRPTGCPEDCPGVCGCDLAFYCNACDAASAGVSLTDRAACEGEPCGTDGVCSPGTLCCPGCRGEGVCVPEGEMCPPVACPEECFSPFECGFDQVCQFPGEACAGPGRCVPVPFLCEDDCPGVCGCDGATYCNACQALTAGVSVAPPERCAGPPTCGRGGDVCAPEEYCDLGDACGATDGQRCQVLPTTCSGAVDPVCGCDGRTYSNGCLANAEGVTVGFLGPCDG